MKSEEKGRQLQTKMQCILTPQHSMLRLQLHRSNVCSLLTVVRILLVGAGEGDGLGSAGDGLGTAGLGDGTAGLGDGTAGLGDGTAGLGDGTAGLGDGTAGDGLGVVTVGIVARRFATFSLLPLTHLPCSSQAIRPVTLCC
jgi:hypothetical protein